MYYGHCKKIVCSVDREIKIIIEKKGRKEKKLKSKEINLN